MNALSNIANPYIQSLTNAAMSALNSFQNTIGNGVSGSTAGVSGSTAIPQDGSPQLSPFAQLMSTLQQLEQSNPTQYGQVTQQIAANLQSASQTAMASGNTAEAQQLTTLANDFTSASTSGQLPNVSDLAQAISGHGHHHHHYHGSGSGSSSSGSAGSTGSTGSTTSANRSAAQSVSELFGAYAGNTAQSDALNPLNIIMNTLESDGITLGN